MNFKSENAITLVALIITIIVLLILAGVTLSVVLGDNGLINKAQFGVDKYQESTNSEQTLFNEIENHFEQVWTNSINPPEKLLADGSWSDLKQINTPKLAEGMIPVKWNGSNWIITTGDDEEWYDYVDTSVSGKTNTSKWANIMLSDGIYSSLTPTPSGKTEATKDTVVEINDLGSMFVWIPRYAYNITSGYHTTSQGEIQIEFLKGTAKTSSQGNTFANINADGSINTSATAGNNKWLVHPAFLNNTTIGGWDRELEGIWVAKFEASSSSSSIKVLPNKSSWRNISTTTIFKKCLEMKNENNIYGLAETSEPHEMKNTEWGAIVYLAHSKYGRNRTQITINDNSSYYTGDNNYVSNVSQSTTGNIYGIYDINGGLWEYVASGLTANVSSTFGNITGFAEKYVNRYRGTSSSQSSNYTANSVKYGDAIYETSNYGTNSNSWYSDYSNFAFSSYPLFTRGGYSGNSSSAGAFAFYYHIGTEHEHNRFPSNPYCIVNCINEEKLTIKK